ncbi:hypothetical protein MKX01_017485 [Papaver californicum]|nr:hypothetical protein MKX01_017485 [Papaver californicum]
MAITLHSSSSFINAIGTKTLKTQEESSIGSISYAQLNSSTCRLCVKSSIKIEPVSSDNKTRTSIFDGKREHEILEKFHGLLGGRKTGSGVPAFVMLPLDTVSIGGNLNRARAMNARVMVDAWWGLVEKDGPSKYKWDGYIELIKMVQKHGLKIQVVMSFHQCGGNYSFTTMVLEEINKNPDLVYTDKSDRRNPEYISLGCDSLPVLKGRTPIQVYSDFMRSFRETFSDYLGGVIVEVQVGMGQLRYPSYPESNGTWRFPGIGEFQCYDKYMRASLKAASVAIKNEKRGISGPHDSGNYNQFPDDTGFFKREGTWNTEHGAAEGIFRGTGAKLSGKVAGIHWHYGTRAHAAELTAGYYNTRNRDGYLAIAQMMAKRGVVLNFTSMEMRDGEQPAHANCSPEGLVKQVKMATKTTGTELAGENALERYDESAFEQVLATSRSDPGNGLTALTYLRMNKRLFEGENWRNLVAFAKNMSEGGRNVGLSEYDTGRSDLYVGLIIKKDKKTKEVVLV